MKCGFKKNTMKHISFFKTCPVPEVFPVVLLQMFTSMAGRWRDDISNMVLLHSKNGCPLMDVNREGSSVGTTHKSRWGFQFQQKLNRKKHCSFTEIVIGELWMPKWIGFFIQWLVKKKGIPGTWITAIAISNSVMYCMWQLRQVNQRFKRLHILF